MIPLYVVIKTIYNRGECNEENFSMNRFEGWNLSLPLIQGGMGVGVSLSGLAGAVASEGGMGVISTAQIGFEEPDFVGNEEACNLRSIRKHIVRAKELASGKE